MDLTGARISLLVNMAKLCFFSPKDFLTNYAIKKVSVTKTAILKKWRGHGPSFPRCAWHLCHSAHISSSMWVDTGSRSLGGIHHGQIYRLSPHGDFDRAGPRSDSLTWSCMGHKLSKSLRHQGSRPLNMSLLKSVSWTYLPGPIQPSDRFLIMCNCCRFNYRFHGGCT